MQLTKKNWKNDPKIFVCDISCSLISFQKLLISNFLINSFMSTPWTQRYDPTFIYIHKPYAQLQQCKTHPDANNLVKSKS